MAMKYSLHLKPVNGGPFNCVPARTVELETEQIRANDVMFAWDFNPHNVGLWVVGNEFGAMFAVWGEEQDILDHAVDLGLMNSFQVADQDMPAHETGKDSEGNIEYDVAYLGNASEPFDLSYCWIQEVDRLSLDLRLAVDLATARANGSDTLDN